jgi:hypothetical protein
MKGCVMARFTDEELADNRLGLKHSRLGTLEILKIDTLVQHPDTAAYHITMAGRGLIIAMSSVMKEEKENQKTSRFYGGA